jgi:peptidyl-tRNA hydrolase
MNDEVKPLFTPIHNWSNLTNCRIKVHNPDTQRWAKFILDNLTKHDKDVLKGCLPIMVKLNGWLHEDTAGMMCMAVESRTQALIKAIDKGDVTSQSYPSTSYQRERHAIGAAMCELIAQGRGNEFFDSITQ